MHKLFAILCSETKIRIQHWNGARLGHDIIFSGYPTEKSVTIHFDAVEKHYFVMQRTVANHSDGDGDPDSDSNMENPSETDPLDDFFTTKFRKYFPEKVFLTCTSFWV